MRKTRLLAFLLTACLATTCFLSGTVAKYSTEKSADDSARVARWSFTVGSGNDGKDIATEDFVFDLFDTINDTKLGTNNAVEVESDVDVNGKEDDATVIAPGTQGFFDIVLTNASEVNATYAIAFAVENTSVTVNGANVTIPVQFKVGNGEWSTNGTPAAVPATAITMNGGTATVRVYWKWDFNGNDTNDTALGTATTEPTLKVTATITAEQVD